MTKDQLALKQSAEESAKQAGFTREGDGWRSSPGKFEGEQWYAPYFYDAWMCGEGEEIGSVTVLDVSDNERAVFGLDVASVSICEDDNGFVFLAPFRG
jgi:hypothetical protein